jgi:hypothetical protein
MFGINSSYYNKSIKKLVISFGTLFNQLYVERYDENDQINEKIRVPLTYGPKEKFYRRLVSDSDITDTTHVQITLPMMGFDITSMIYDPTRRLNKLQTVYSETNNTLKKTWTEVPYIINFGLYIFSRNIDDNLQIVEQILPNFTPEFNISLNLNELNTRVTVPIILNAVNTTEDYEGDFQTRRSITSVFDFTAKTYLYAKIKEESPSTLIQDIDVNVFRGLTVGNNTLIEDFGYTGNYAANTITWRL